VDNVQVNLHSAVEGADLVILSVPLHEVRDTLNMISTDLKEGAWCWIPPLPGAKARRWHANSCRGTLLHWACTCHPVWAPSGNRRRAGRRTRRPFPGCELPGLQHARLARERGTAGN